MNGSVTKTESKAAMRQWYAEWVRDLKKIADIHVDEYDCAKCALCSKTICAAVSPKEDWATHQSTGWPFIHKTFMDKYSSQVSRTATRTIAASSATNASISAPQTPTISGLIIFRRPRT